MESRAAALAHEFSLEHRNIDNEEHLFSSKCFQISPMQVGSSAQLCAGRLTTELQVADEHYAGRHDASAPGLSNAMLQGSPCLS